VKHSWTKYAILTAVFLCSAAFTCILRPTELVGQLAAIPGVFALIGVIYQLIRDEAAHIRALALQHDQQRFALGITSHMADVTFDRHVQLCDDFVRELFLTLQCLLNNPQDHEGAKKRADAIGDTIRKHAAWITPRAAAPTRRI
jgi:hypothetical protein